MFKLDYSEVKDFGAVPDGLYEVVINSVKEDATPNGAEFINFDFIIRNDIKQERQNSHLFHRVWKTKTENKYNKGMIMAIAKSFGLQDGKEYQSFEQFLEDFNFKTGKVRIKNETSEYNNKTYENTNIKQFLNSAFPVSQHQFKVAGNSPDAVNESAPTINEEDLPF